MEFRNYTVHRFLTELKGDLSSPGGGSTAALVTSLAASLNSMVYSFTVDKKVFDTLEDDDKLIMRQLKEESDNFIEKGLEFMEADRKTFTELMDTFKLPNSTDEEKIYRKKSIREKTINAMEVPYDLAKNSLRFYENIEFAVKFGNKNLMSDGIVAAILLHGAIESAVVNVLVNYNSLNDKSGYENVQKECSEIIESSVIKKNKILKYFGM